MHKRFLKNLSKLLIVAITIPSTPINLAANTVYGKEININQSTQTTTGSSLEITDTNETTEFPLEKVDVDKEVTTAAALNIKALGSWDGITMVEPAFEDNTYLITSAEEFKWLEDAVNTGSLETTDIVISVQNDIDFNNHSVTIGTEDYPYKGDFIGNGYTLYNLDFTDALTNLDNYVGLFGYTIGLDLSDINVKAVISSIPYSSQNNNFGCLIGYADEMKEIKNVSVELDVYDDNRSTTNFGGIVGEVHYLDQLLIDNINVNLKMDYSYYKTYVGGAIGKISSKSTTYNIEIANSNMDLYLNDNTTFSSFGGFIGFIENKPLENSSFIAHNLNMNFDINNDCYNFGGITPTLNNFDVVDITDCNAEIKFIPTIGTSSYSGHLIGRIEMRKVEDTSINIENCEVKGFSTTSGSRGMIDYITGSADITILNCKSYVDGDSLYASAMYNGSLVCYLSSCNTLTIIDCENYGDLNSSSELGGLIGFAQCNAFNMESCKNYGILKSTDNAAGGLIGEVHLTYSSEDFGVIKDCINYGDVSGYSDVGGISGKTYGGFKIDNCKMLGRYGIAGRSTVGVAVSRLGGIISSMYSGKILTSEITNCYVELKIINPDESIGGLVCENWGSGLIIDNNIVVGNLENTIESDEFNYDYSFAGLVARSFQPYFTQITNNHVSDIHLNARGDSTTYSGLIGSIQSVGSVTGKDNMTIENNTLSNISYTSEDGSEVLMSGLLASGSVVGPINIINNTLQNVSLKSNNDYSSALIGNLTKTHSSGAANIKNNLVEVTLDSDVENGDLVGYTDCALDFGGNIILVEGNNLRNGYYEVAEDSVVTQSLPNYYNKDIRGEVESQLFTPLSTNEFKQMKNFVGLDFNNTWGFTDENLDYPTLAAQSYNIASEEENIDLCIGFNNPLTINVSHPSLLSSVTVMVEDENIATIENGKIIPLKEGTTRLIFSTEDLPLSEQLQFVQSITVKDLIPKLDLKPITIKESESIPSAIAFIELFALENPFDEELINNVTENASYEILSVKDDNGTEVADLNALTEGSYLVTIKADYNDYALIKEVELAVQKEIKEINSITYDDAKLSVEFGTGFNELILPNNVSFIYGEEEIYKVDELAWEANDYDPSNPGEYVLSATITLPDGFVFNGSQTVTLYKTVEVLAKDEVEEDKPNEDEDQDQDQNQDEDDDDDYDDNQVIHTPSKKEEAQKTYVNVSFKIGHDKWYVDDKAQVFSMDQAPELKNSRAYVPLRFLSYALQVEEDHIKWNNLTKEVSITDGENTIKLKLNSNKAYINGRAYTMDGMPYLSNDRIMVPISQIQGLFEHKHPTVSWDQGQMKVNIKLELKDYQK